MEVLNDILGYKNRKIFQDDRYFSFSLDSIMLANFVNIRLRDKRILDLGTGNGVIPLILSLRTDKKIIGVELQEKLAHLAKKSITYNELEDQIEIVNINMKDYITNDNVNSFDVITCNPPYFKVNDKNVINMGLEKAIARHEVEITLSDIFCISKKLLNNNGTLAIVHRSDRLLEILDLYRQNGIEPKRMQFVYENPDRDSTLVLIEGTKNGKPGLKVESPIILYDKNGNKSDEYETILMEVRK